MNIIKTPLEIEDTNIKFYYNQAKIQEIEEEIENFVFNNQNLFKNDFVRNTLFPFEIKNNNSVEGYNDNLEEIMHILNKPNISQNSLETEKRRVLNLKKGYDYILKEKEINQKDLKKLYDILSDKLLESEEKLIEGKNYRTEEVYIFYSSITSVKPDNGMKAENVEKYMNILLEYINTNNDLSVVEKFIKSQIIHFYFVYIHPYYDINGRTSRTTAIWYLNNHKAYPFVLFNRGITLAKNEYYTLIREAKKYKNLTTFLYYIMLNTKKELEKEYIINMINQNTNGSLTKIERQILQYIISNKGNNTLLDLTTFYNRFNPKKTYKQINDEYLEELINKGVIKKLKNTSKNINGDNKNYFYSLNNKSFEYNPEVIKRLNLK